MQTITLLIDKRLEMSTKYKKVLDSASNRVIVSRDLLNSIKIIKDSEPDLIIISGSVDEDLSSFCSQIRALTYNMRPVIVALSKSADINDRINVLNSGADDFLSEPVNIKEFQIRIYAHLRREYESNLDTKQFLPNSNYSLRFLKRSLSDGVNSAVLYLKIANFEEYKKAYTELASDKLLQTYSAIIRASLSDSDFVGKLSEDSFIIITDPVKAESVARFLTFALDSIIPKFYAEHDLTRGYMILQGDEFAGKRANFVHFTISGVINENSLYKDYSQILAVLTQLNSLADLPDRSNYLIDRPKISAKESVQNKVYNNKVYIYETDEALSTLLHTILALQGYSVHVKQVFCVPKKSDIPALFIIDAGDLEKKNGLNLCYKIKNDDNHKYSKIIVTSIIHDKELVLNTGADLYLPKPYDIPTLIRWVDALIKEFNA